MGLGMIMLRIFSQLLPEVDTEAGPELKWFTWAGIPGSTIIGVGRFRTGKQGMEGYLAGSNCGHLGFSHPGDRRSCAEHASEFKKLEYLFTNSYHQLLCVKGYSWKCQLPGNYQLSSLP